MTHLYLLPRPILFAHRGASASAPENTLAAFRLAVRQGAPAIELDVKLSADGQVMVFHDPTVNRTTDGTGFVHRLPLAELRELDAGGKFDPRFRGERIPTLTEVFEEVGHDIFINVELTNYVTPLDSLVDMTTQIVRYMGMENQVLFSSFLANNLFRARKFLPEVPAAILFGEGMANRRISAWLGRRAAPRIAHPHYTDATAEYIQKAHAMNRRVHVWTVNDPDEMRRLFALDVDGIFVDDPQLALRILEER